jgi:hypothetical protein
MRLPNTAHTSRPWRIHELTRDFRIEDVWALPTPGGPDDFRKLVNGIGAAASTESGSPIIRALFAIRLKLGALFGWDDVDADTPTLRDRLPDDLRNGPTGPHALGLGFTPLYLLPDEWAAELANRTMHGVLHLGWVDDPETGGHRGQLTVLVKPNGLLGQAYMAGIRPFRHTLVYPALLRRIGSAWRAGAPA